MFTILMFPIYAVSVARMSCHVVVVRPLRTHRWFQPQRSRYIVQNHMFHWSWLMIRFVDMNSILVAISVSSRRQTQLWSMERQVHIRVADHAASKEGATIR